MNTGTETETYQGERPSSRAGKSDLARHVLFSAFAVSSLSESSPVHAHPEQTSRANCTMPYDSFVLPKSVRKTRPRKAAASWWGDVPMARAWLDTVHVLWDHKLPD